MAFPDVEHRNFGCTELTCIQHGHMAFDGPLLLEVLEDLSLELRSNWDRMESRNRQESTRFDETFSFNCIS